MARKKYPPIIPTGNRLCGGTPPEKMSEEERIAWATARSIESAKAIGGRPNGQTSEKAV